MTDYLQNSTEQRQRVGDADDGSLPRGSLFSGMIVIGLLCIAIVLASIAQGYLFLFRVIECTPSQRIIRGALAAIVPVAEILSAALIMRAFWSRNQSLPTLIFHQRLPTGLRLLLCLWWGMHFFALLCVSGDIAHLEIVLAPTPYQHAATWLVRYVIELGLTFGQNIFLFLGISAAVGHGPLLRWLVRRRFLIDFALAGISMVLPLSAIQFLEIR